MLGFDGEFTAIQPIDNFFFFLAKKFKKINSKAFHKKLGKLNKLPKMLEFDGQFPAKSKIAKFRRFLEKYCKISALKHFTDN